jgi:ADP-ribose pyrophosphatase
VSGPHNALAPWETLCTRRILDLPPWFGVLKDTVRLPSGRVVDDFYRIEAPDYVLIAARRADGSFLMERHFKQCLGRVILTCPSGGVEAGETPLDAARRELLEETGYLARNWSALGSYVVDGTRGICTAHLFRAEDLSPGAPPVQDDMEQMELAFLPPDQLRRAIRDGGIALLPDLALLALTLNGG